MNDTHGGLPRLDRSQRGVALSSPMGDGSAAGVESRLESELLRCLRGSVLSYQASDADLDRIADGSARRGVLVGGFQARKVKRSAADEAELQTMCEWLAAQGLDLIGSVSFTDAYAASHGIYSLSRAIADVYAGLHGVSMNRGRFQGFRGRYVLSGEWHPSGRAVPHVHLALDSMGVVDTERMCSELWQYFYNTRGRSRFEPMRDVTEATLYGLKDTLKACRQDAGSLVLKLGRSRGRRSSR